MSSFFTLVAQANENPVNPLMYVLCYGAPFVAQGTPADLPGLAAMIEAASPPFMSQAPRP